MRLERKEIMEIQDLKVLIEIDESTRKKIEEAHRIKNELRRSVAEEKQRISEETWKQVKEQVEKTKIEIDMKAKQASSDNKEAFEKSSQQLRATFENNHQKWCKEIVDRCIK